MKLVANQNQLLQTAIRIDSNCFEKIQKELDVETNIGKFIHDVLGDYLYDIVYSVQEDPDYQITKYFDNDFNSYINQILTDSLHSRIAVINCLKIYFSNYDELRELSSDEISDESYDYYQLMGANLTSETFDYAFSKSELVRVNPILMSLNLNPIAY
ncbi:MAG TPA: hypothetical protein K8V06_04160 [Ligilactobacillus salivarius]|uniref:Uncharacterized protein n=1 Tax=Ligilactobacillus salivarius TaxID=1624 RepID=A0A921LK06_9LACO|nr:hypothetical protein [Ligilactobacillus salivarius]